jgi:hypothetical protein
MKDPHILKAFRKQRRLWTQLYCTAEKKTKKKSKKKKESKGSDSKKKIFH